uniref:Uncharacterized protein n=1 Tax=Arundo donax TaxID=35708 RepID=A0A0A9AXA3_ARUDO
MGASLLRRPRAGLPRRIQFPGGNHTRFGVNESRYGVDRYLIRGASSAASLSGVWTDTPAFVELRYGWLSY